MNTCRHRLLQVVLLSVLIFGPDSTHAAPASEGRTRNAVKLEDTLQDLKAESAEKRVNAVRALGKFSSDRSVSALIGACADTHMSVRRFALRSLRSIGNPKALKTAEACLSDKYPAVRKEAADTIDAISEDPLGTWREILGNATDSHARATALSRVTELRPEEFASEIRKSARDRQAAIRCAAAKGLAALGEKEDVAALKALATDRDTGVRRAVADACLQLKEGREAVAILRPLCSDADRGVRRYCIDRLAKVSSVDVGAVYLDILAKEEVEGLRALAAERIGSVAGASRYVEGLMAARTRETSARVRTAIERALHDIQTPGQDETAGAPETRGIQRVAAKDRGTAGTDVVITEVCYWPAKGIAEWVELLNASGEAVNMGGWLLTDGHKLFLTLPDEVPELPPGAFARVMFDGTNRSPSVTTKELLIHTPPGLSDDVLGNEGGHIALYTGPEGKGSPVIKSYVAWGLSPAAILEHRKRRGIAASRRGQ